MSHAVPVSSSAAPTLELDAAIFAREGAAPEAPLTLQFAAGQLGLVGDWDVLFEAALGTARRVSGTAQMAGSAIEDCLAQGTVGLAMCDPVLPGSFTVDSYLAHAARLAHGHKARAEADAARVLADFGLRDLAGKKLASLVPYQRRALGIATAALGRPRVICLQTPLFGLDAAAADYVHALVRRAREQCPVVVTGPRPISPSPEQALFDDCDCVALRAHGTLVAQGPPAAVFSGQARYLLTLVGSNGARFEDIVRGSGSQIAPTHAPANLPNVLPTEVSPHSYVVDLAPGASTDVLLDAALDTEMLVVELEPATLAR